MPSPTRREREAEIVAALIENAEHLERARDGVTGRSVLAERAFEAYEECAAILRDCAAGGTHGMA